MGTKRVPKQVLLNKRMISQRKNLLQSPSHRQTLAGGAAGKPKRQATPLTSWMSQRHQRTRGSLQKLRRQRRKPKRRKPLRSKGMMIQTKTRGTIYTPRYLVCGEEGSHLWGASPIARGVRSNSRWCVIA